MTTTSSLKSSSFPSIFQFQELAIPSLDILQHPLNPGTCSDEEPTTPCRGLSRLTRRPPPTLKNFPSAESLDLMDGILSPTQLPLRFPSPNNLSLRFPTPFHRVTSPVSAMEGFGEALVPRLLGLNLSETPSTLPLHKPYPVSDTSLPPNTRTHTRRNRRCRTVTSGRQARFDAVPRKPRSVSGSDRDTTPGLQLTELMKASSRME